MMHTLHHYLTRGFPVLAALALITLFRMGYQMSECFLLALDS